MSFRVRCTPDGFVVEDGPLMGGRINDAGTHVEGAPMEPRPIVGKIRQLWSIDEVAWKYGYAQAMLDAGVKPEQTAVWMAGKAWEKRNRPDDETVRDAHGRVMREIGEETW